MNKMGTKSLPALAFMPVPVDSDRATKTRRIHELNDALRTTFAGGHILVTAGVGALPSSARAAAMQKVRDFAAVTPENDLYEVHDFDNFDHAGRKLFWKIDHYAPDMQGGSQDPSDPAVTERVLSVEKTAAVDHSALLRDLDPRQRRLLELFWKQGLATSTEMAAHLKMSPRTVVQFCREWIATGFLEYQSAARKNRSCRLGARLQWLFSSVRARF